MKDNSSATWFNVGDRVRVIEDVMKNKTTNLKGRIGTVVETWEKCDVDPTCCCAEQVDLGMAVHVRFAVKNDLFEGDDYFVYYFAEEELDNVKEEEDDTSSSSKETTVPFDGLSCTTFKLDQLKMGAQAQRIAAFEAERSKSSSSEQQK